ncbi:MAG TPA: replication factor C large subunit [Candidatus Altiarchaeales archaeon]|nr:replication factor C large subunit [Candidatus Altiarchaeales archaeon]
MWSQKYMPKKFSEVIGHKDVIEKLKTYKWDKPLLLYGAPGVGKTMFTNIIANEFNFEPILITETNIKSVLASSQTTSIDGKKRLLIIDNVDLMSNIRDVIKLIKETKNPIILTANDIRDRKLREIRNLCESINVRRPTPQLIVKILKRICSLEAIYAEEVALKKIAENAKGDVRAAINDLETIAKNRKRITVEDTIILEYRDRKAEIYQVLGTILMKKNIKQAITIMWNLDMELDSCEMWIDENLPYVYSDKEDLARAYYYLSRADIFLGRITSRQYWGFMRYASSLMSAGVSLSKRGKIKYRTFQFPKYFLNLSKTKKARDIKKRIGKKIAKKLHTSSKTIISQYIPLFKVLLNQGKISRDFLSKEYDLTPDEIDFIEES